MLDKEKNSEMNTLKEALSASSKLSYQPNSIETNVRQFWTIADCFQPSFQGESYCIMQPPPNVTGVLHMGHAFQTALMDGLIRYHRMKGLNTLWQPGIDHAGIATQMVVENQLALHEKTREGIGRTAFVEAVWEWKEKSGSYIVKQFHRMGASADWARSRFTLDDHFSAAVRKAFITLYEEGLIYKGKRLINWDPKLRTAVSDVEVLSEEEEGFLWHLKYPLTEGGGELIVATTRPETLFGDTAVAVNPHDPRYKSLIGKTLRLPLTEREIPIVADDMVDATFGTGCVKITPAHDFNDFELAKRHNLPLIDIFTPSAHLNEKVPLAYQGLERFAARTKLVKELEENEILHKTEPHVSRIPRGEKSGVVVEPRLMEQWFVKMEPLAKAAILAVEQGEIKFVPEKWTKTYFQWMNNIQDWCISRQLWWGHRIPVWYDEAGKTYVGENELEVRKKYHLEESVVLIQEEDVLDTWFSAAMWPFVTLGWPDKTPALESFYPSHVLVTGFDIIFFWVARMAMFGLKFMGSVPFKEVYITGLIYDREGKKMSKTRGNVLDPVDLIDGIDIEALVKKRTYGLMQPKMAKTIEKNTRLEFAQGISAYGADALRFSFYTLASTGNNINFNIQYVQDAHHFCNKLWNAAKYVMHRMEQQKIAHVLVDNKVDYSQLGVVDRWIISKLQQVILTTEGHYKNYRFDFLAKSLYEFVWNDFCDWYLELSKYILQDPKATEDNKSLHSWTLVTSLESILRLLHPLIPFMTEGLWQAIKSFKHIEADTLMTQPYPSYNEKLMDNNAEEEISWLQRVISEIRSLRALAEVSPAVEIELALKGGDQQDTVLAERYQGLLKSVAKLSKIGWDFEPAPVNHMAVAGKLEIYVSIKNEELQGFILKARKKIEKDTAEIEKRQRKIDNLKRLPSLNDIQKALIEKEEADLHELQAAKEKKMKHLVQVEKVWNLCQ
jgi:valyl-tRNA synthetase